jgi:hypothetical protein
MRRGEMGERKVLDRDTIPEGFWLEEIKLYGRPGEEIQELVRRMWQWAYENLKVGETVSANFNGVDVTMKKKRE